MLKQKFIDIPKALNLETMTWTYLGNDKSIFLLLAMQGFATIANSQAMKAKIVRLQMGKIPNYFVSSVIKWDIWQGRVQMWQIIPGKI